jgi:hypothetical protein
MMILIVYGFNTEEDILANCYGKNSREYKANMAPVWMAFEKLFALLRQAAPSLEGETGPENPDTTVPYE